LLNKKMAAPRSSERKPGSATRSERFFRNRRRRRVAIVGYVGPGANFYLGDPQGIEIICWPRAGGTNAAAVRDLVKRGAVISFADRVHMKLYWSRGGDAVIGSPNLSTNALGAGDLKELALRVAATTSPPGRLDTEPSRRRFGRLVRKAGGSSIRQMRPAAGGGYYGNFGQG
jgi:hypothetical protein